MVQRTPRGPDRFAAEEQRRRSHPVATHLLADRDEPVPTVVVLIEQAEPGQRAEQATQERLLGAAHDGEVRARCGTGRELVRDADLHGDRTHWVWRIATISSSSRARGFSMPGMGTTIGSATCRVPLLVARCDNHQPVV